MKEILEKSLSYIDGELGWIIYEIAKITNIIAFGEDIEVSYSERQGGNVRVYKSGNFGFASFTKPEDVALAAKKSSSLSKFEKKSEIFLKKPLFISDKFYPKLGNDPRKVSISEKVELIKNYNKLFLNAKDKIRNAVIKYNEVDLKKFLLRTDGSYIEENRVYSGIAFSAFAIDGSRVQPFHDSFGDQRGFDTVLNREGDIERAISNAFLLLKSDKVEGGIYTAILDPDIAGVFIHEAFGHLSEADHIYRNERLKEIMKPGNRVGSEILNAIDDGSIVCERGFYKYDDEGTPSSKTYLIKNGILNSRLHSIYTASLMNEEFTGNARAINYRFPPIVRMSCTYIEPGEKNFEELIEDIKYGIYVKGSIGGQTELEMFTFSAQCGYIIKDGKIKEPVRDVILTGNVFETLKNIDAVGNDLVFRGGLGGCGKNGQYPLPVSTGSPHIRIKNILIGGK
ncbi:MAG: TldD/PmbA family protein [Candidatus Hydrothermales bacterium]